MLPVGTAVAQPDFSLSQGRTWAPFRSVGYGYGYGVV